MYEVRLNQKNITGMRRKQTVLMLKIPRSAFDIIQFHLPVPVQRYAGKIVGHPAVIITVGNLHGAVLAFFFRSRKHHKILLQKHVCKMPEMAERGMHKIIE